MGQRILVVEDNPGDAELIIDRLVHLGHDVVWKTDLAAGVRALAGAPFDAVLLDLSLPDSHGVESVATTFFFDAETPIIVLTGNPDDDVALQAMAAGAHHVLVKDRTDDDVLQAAIRDATTRFEVQQQLGGDGDGIVQVVPLPTGAGFLAALKAHLAAADADHLLYVACDRPADRLRSEFAQPGPHFIDATGARHEDGRIYCLDDPDDLSALGLEIERACAAIGQDSHVVVDGVQSLVLRHGIDDAVRFLRSLAGRLRLLGLRLDVLAHRDAQWPLLVDRLDEL